MLSGAHIPESGADVEHAGSHSRNACENVDTGNSQKKAGDEIRQESHIHKIQKTLNGMLGKCLGSQSNRKYPSAFAQPLELPAYYFQQQQDTGRLHAARGRSRTASDEHQREKD